MRPLPEGDRYLGFLFARGVGPAEAEAALREAHARLEVVLDPPDAADRSEGAESTAEADAEPAAAGAKVPA